MKSLFISYDGLTDPLGQSQVIPYLIGLRKNGFEMHVLSCEKKEEYITRKEVISKLLTDNNIHWHPVFYHKSPPVFSTIYDIYKLKKNTLELHTKYTFDILHCRSYISALIGMEMKKKLNTKFIFDMRGFWADERLDGGIWKLSNPIYKGIYNYFKRKEKQFFQNADQIISLTHNGKNIIKSGELGYKVDTPIKVIPCCVDLDLFKPTNNDIEKSQNEFIISYIGSIGTWYMLDEMLDFFKVLLRKKEDAKFLFITREPKELILNKCKEKGINSDSIIIKSAERNEVPHYIAMSDVSVFFIKPVFSKRASSPTKQGEIMGMGVPIICNTKVGDTDHVIEKYNSGILVNSFDESEYEKTVAELLNSNFSSAVIEKGAKKFYSLELGIKNYAEVYRECLK